MIKEACIDSLAQAILAENNGAHRLEICSDLHLDGLTPPIELVTQIQTKTSLPLKVMIRPRSGDFNHSKEEIAEMIQSIEAFTKIGIRHFVVGLLINSSSINHRGLKKICHHFPGCQFTFHKAIDFTNEIIQEVENLKEIKNVEAILTSGGATSALEGINNLRKMIKASEGKIQIVAAGSITNNNLYQIHKLITAEAYHGRRIVGDLN